MVKRTAACRPGGRGSRLTAKASLFRPTRAVHEEKADKRLARSWGERANGGARRVRDACCVLCIVYAVLRCVCTGPCLQSHLVYTARGAHRRCAMRGMLDGVLGVAAPPRQPCMSVMAIYTVQYTAYCVGIQRAANSSNPGLLQAHQRATSGQRVGSERAACLSSPSSAQCRRSAGPGGGIPDWGKRTL